jgi:hypothetical protein
MNTSSMPGFTAQVSLRRATGHYASHGHTRVPPGEVHPALVRNPGGISVGGNGLMVQGFWCELACRIACEKVTGNPGDCELLCAFICS